MDWLNPTTKQMSTMLLHHVASRVSRLCLLLAVALLLPMTGASLEAPAGPVAENLQLPPSSLVADSLTTGASAGDGWAWGPLGSGMSGGAITTRVVSLTTFEGALVAGGFFATAGGVDADFIAQWDGSTWAPVGDGMSGAVRALTVYDGDLIAGGGFLDAGGETVNGIARWNGSEWQPLGGGVTNPSSGNQPFVSALTVWNGDLIASGRFTHAGGNQVNLVARWDGAEWHSLGDGIFGFNGPTAEASALAVYDGDLIVGGNYDLFLQGPNANNIARWDGSAWHRLGDGMGGVTIPAVVALTVHEGDLIAGGAFLTAGGQDANRVARWDGTEWHPLGGGFPDIVRDLEVHDNALIAGGSFLPVGGPRRIARWDGSSWQSLGTGMNNVVHSLLVHEGDLIAGGAFTAAGGVSAQHIARWAPVEPPAGLIVTNTSNAGPGSLRQALLNANDPGYAAFDTVEFQIPETDANYNAETGVWSILLASGLPPLRTGLTVDALHGGQTPRVELIGSSAGSAHGLVALGESVISGFIINQFSAAGIILAGGAGNQVLYNYIGTNGTASEGLPNGSFGVYIDGSSDNVIAHNVLSGNNVGVHIQQATAVGNSIHSNRIGTDVHGMVTIPNAVGGIRVANGPRQTHIASNVISGNAESGIWIYDVLGLGTDETVVEDNAIGLNASGSSRLPNALHGIRITNAPNTTIRANVLSGNRGAGLFMEDLPEGEGETQNTTVKGNRIGTSFSGTANLGNTGPGVHLVSVHHNLIGGWNMGDGNLISGNGGLFDGVLYPNPGIAISAGSTNNHVSGNLIGTDRFGNIVEGLGNFSHGIVISSGSHANVIGLRPNDPGTANLIAGNGEFEGSGIAVTGALTTNNPIAGNRTSDNGILGIDLGADGVTPNDGDDSDSGPNRLQNFPVIEIADYDADAFFLTVDFSVPSAPQHAAYPLRIEFFLADSSPAGQGKHLLGITEYATGDYPNDRTSFFPVTAGAAAIGPGARIVATATDADGNTSEFSAPYDLSVQNESAAIAVTQPIETAGVYGFAEGDADTYASLDLVEVADPGTVTVVFVPVAPTRSNDAAQAGEAGSTAADDGTTYALYPAQWYAIAEGLFSAEGQFRLSLATLPPNENLGEDGLTLLWRPLFYSGDFTALETVVSDDFVAAPFVGAGEFALGQASPVSTTDGEPGVQRVALHPNYPNPFRRTTTIAFDLPSPESIDLVVFDVLGREVRRLASGHHAAGSHEVLIDTDALPSGLYLYRLRVGNEVLTRQMMVVGG